jgi:hypothetical protein
MRADYSWQKRELLLGFRFSFFFAGRFTKSLVCVAVIFLTLLDRAGTAHSRLNSEFWQNP